MKIFLGGDYHSKKATRLVSRRYLSYYGSWKQQTKYLY